MSTTPTKPLVKFADLEIQGAHFTARIIISKCRHGGFVIRMMKEPGENEWWGATRLGTIFRRVREFLR